MNNKNYNEETDIQSKKAFIVHPTYKVYNDKAYVFLFGRLESGESFVTINPYRPYFYIETKNSKKAKEIIKSSEITGDFEFENTEFTNFNSKKMTKILLNIPKEIQNLRKDIENEGIKCYESDVRFEYRFMIDNNIQGSTLIKYNKEKCIVNKKDKHKQNILPESFLEENFYTDYVIYEPEFEKAWYNPKLKVLSLDIETDRYANNIFSIAMYFVDPYNNKKIITENLISANRKVENAISFENEKKMLEYFINKVYEMDPDLITGWNFIDFDIKVLSERFKTNKLEFNIGRINWLNKLIITNDFMKESKADIPGRMLVDGISILKNNFIKLTDYKLDTAASEILQERKLITETESKAEQIETMFIKNPNELIKYNAKDAELVMKILNKHKLIDLIIKRSMLTGMPLDRVQASVATLDSLYLRKAKEKKIVCSSVDNNDKDSPGKGGYVMEPKAGIYDNVVVLDFKSLYPSIIMTFNIDPLTLITSKKKENEFIEAPNGAYFRNSESILPEMIREQMKHRETAKEKKDDVESHAIKIIMNSFYGALGNPGCRFFSMSISNAITYFGQFIIQNTAKEINKIGYEVIYSDTDSVFVDTKTNDSKQAEIIGLDLEKKMNEYYLDWVKKNHKRNSELHLEFEKNFIKIIFPRQRGEEKGAKKRYAGILIKNGKEKLEFTGLEFVRRDWTELSKKFQLELLDRVFHEKPIINFVKKFLEDIKNGKYDDLMIYVKGLRKDLSAYTKTTPPHVKAARKLDKIDSNVIKYVMTTEGPEPIQKKRNLLDYNHYIEKQIKPIADSILGFYNTSLDDIAKGTTQRELFDY